MCECHLLRQCRRCPEIIHDLDEGQRERKRRRVDKHTVFNTAGKKRGREETGEERRLGV